MSDTLPRMVAAWHIPVLFEDAALLAVDKPVGIAAIPERDLAVPSAQKLLEAARGERLFVVHRIDKEVSGVLVFARTAVAHRELSMAFERRNVDKSYLAVVHGVAAAFRQGPFTIDAPIHAFGSGRMGIDRRGKASQTEVRVVARRDTTTLVEARPLTGRRHQIRVHLYHVGHPIVGDLRYGDRTLQAQSPRLMLHAWRIVLPNTAGPSWQLESAPAPEFGL